METIIKALVRLALIPVVVWVIQLIIAFVQGIREGIQEDKEAKLQEELKMSEAAEELKVKEVDNVVQLQEEQVLLLERMAIALACPFRAVLITSKGDGESPHLQRLGCLDDEEKESLKMVLSRDFEFIFDVEEAKSVGVQMMDHIFNVKESGWGVVMTVSTQLHILTACVDLGYIQFSDYTNLVLHLIETIKNYTILQSWKDYAREFLKDEKGANLNRFLGRMLLKYQTGRLLEKEDSPWMKIPWEALKDLHYEKQFIPLENPKEYLADWHEAKGCIVSDKISVDGCRVGYMYREEPLDEDDSGWAFLEGNESEEYRANWTNDEVLSLDTICNYDPDIVPYLSEPYGSAFRRDNSGKFQKVGSWQEMRE